ncbi:MAG: DNA translocase FtsK, partial [Muribaculaceae bacterium]|nr:DNA translocase FtsK [Muribaculaceae bacterium]
MIRWGGNHGYYANSLLIDYASPFGAICVSIALVSLVAILYLAELTALYMAYRRKIDAIRARKAAEEERREAERARVEAEMQTPAAAEEEQTPAAATDYNESPSQPIDLTDSMDYQPTDDDTPSYPAYDDIDSTDDPDDSTPEAADKEEDDTQEAGFVVETNEIEEAKVINTDTFDPTAELSHYHFPSINLLVDRAGSSVTVDTEEQEQNKERIIKALEQFHIKISSIKATVGPTITLFEVVPAEGQRIAAIKRVEEDLALALKANGIRIIAPIPGKGTIGIEVPNADPQTVSMRSIIASRRFQECRYELPMALGATISNEVFIADLAKMPHLLVAGATGQGKSVGLNAIITSLLYKKHPAELKFVLVDPKMVEFSLYRVLERHYLAKLPDEDDAVITDCSKVVT